MLAWKSGLHRIALKLWFSTGNSGLHTLTHILTLTPWSTLIHMFTHIYTDITHTWLEGQKNYSTIYIYIYTREKGIVL